MISSWFWRGMGVGVFFQSLTWKFCFICYSQSTCDLSQEQKLLKSADLIFMPEYLIVTWKTLFKGTCLYLLGWQFQLLVWYWSLFCKYWHDKQKKHDKKKNTDSVLGFKTKGKALRKGIKGGPVFFLLCSRERQCIISHGLSLLLTPWLTLKCVSVPHL